MPGNRSDRGWEPDESGTAGPARLPPSPADVRTELGTRARLVLNLCALGS